MGLGGLGEEGVRQQLLGRPPLLHVNLEEESYGSRLEGCFFLIIIRIGIYQYNMRVLGEIA